MIIEIATGAILFILGLLFTATKTKYVAYQKSIQPEEEDKEYYNLDSHEERRNPYSRPPHFGPTATPNIEAHYFGFCPPPAQGGTGKKGETE